MEIFPNELVCLGGIWHKGKNIRYYEEFSKTETASRDPLAKVLENEGQIIILPKELSTLCRAKVIMAAYRMLGNSEVWVIGEERSYRFIEEKKN